MKHLLMLLIASVCLQSATAQFSRASLQASGLTCAMCSNAIQKALQTLPFVDAIEVDLNLSAFDIQFKQGAQVDLDMIRKKVEGAGFSVAQLDVWASFNGLSVKNDAHIAWNKQTLHFLNVKPQVLQGEQKLTLLDKNFVPAKDTKKYSSYTRKTCFKTGVAEACCTSDGISPQTRIYHVTI